MKFYLLVVSLLVSIGYQVSAQTTTLGTAQGGDYMNNAAFGVLSELKRPERAATGSTYIDDNWVPGKIELTNGHVLADILIRYDISLNQIEVKIDGVVRGVRGENAKSFTVFNPTTQANDVYVNASAYQVAGGKPAGFFKVVTTGEWSLLEKAVVTLEKPSYNPVLDVGEEEPKYVKSSTLYIAQNNSVTPVPKSKKVFLESLNEQSDGVAAYMKKMSLSLKKTADIKLIVDFLNKV